MESWKKESAGQPHKSMKFSEKSEMKNYFPGVPKNWATSGFPSSEAAPSEMNPFEMYSIVS